jgi:telomere length regulation protein
MIVGTAVSELVDPMERRMNFTAEEVDSTEGKWYRSLTEVQDSIGSISDLKRGSPVSKRKNANSRAEVGNENPPKALVQPASSSKIVSIEEIESDFASEEDDLPMYEKPDSDASDTDEDPTLVQRDKPSAPVYVENLSLFFVETYAEVVLILDTSEISLLASGILRIMTGTNSHYLQHRT